MSSTHLYKNWHNCDFRPYQRRLIREDYSGQIINIDRIVPGENEITIFWENSLSYLQFGDSDYIFLISYSRDNFKQNEISLSKNKSEYTITNLKNGCDYKLCLYVIESESRNVLARSPIRIVRPGHVPGTVINYIHPEDYTYGFSGRSPASPSIVKLDEDEYLVSHDIYWGGAGQNLTKLFRSTDGGNTWSFVTDLFPCFWGKLFVHRDVLYMLAVSTEYGSLLIGRSRDGGKTWSSPSLILKGGCKDIGGPHKAPVPVVKHRGRIWSAIEYGSWSIGGHAAGVISAPENSDLLNPTNWEITPFLEYDPSWPGTICGGEAPHGLEGNVVIHPEDKLVNILRYHTRGGRPDYGKAIMLDINQNTPEKPLSFSRIIDFPGNMSKFTIRYHNKSQKYWSLVNRVTTSNINQRNVLSLISSPDLINWNIVKDILNYEDKDWSESNQKVGFQYVDWLFEGNDIIAVSRTAINGAYNYHNANHITFHRIKDFY